MFNKKLKREFKEEIRRLECKITDLKVESNSKIKTLNDKIENYIDEIKYPNGRLYSSRGHSYSSVIYEYYVSGETYECYIESYPIEKYFIKKDKDNIYLILKIRNLAFKLEDYITISYVIQIGTNNLIKIDTPIIDNKIKESEWIPFL